MKIEKCWFCSSSIYPGHGIQFVRNDAKIFKFCRSKCHKNFKLKRNPCKMKWTKAYMHLHGKDMTEISTFKFERKQNRPERYDRNVIENTLKAIKKIVKVREDRATEHHEKRMKGKKAKEDKKAKTKISMSINLVKAPASLLQEQPKIKVPVSQSLIFPWRRQQRHLQIYLFPFSVTHSCNCMTLNKCWQWCY